MLRNLILSGAAALLAFVLPAPTQDPAANTGTVLGQVTDPGSGEPLPHIQVSYPEGKSGGQTNEDGLFLLREIPFGTATVLFEHPCFHPVSVTVELSSRLPERRVDVGMPYDIETEAETGCDRRIR
jgi:hypothetical protein